MYPEDAPLRSGHAAPEVGVTWRDKAFLASVHFEHRRCPLCGADAPQEMFHDVNRREGYPIEGTLVRCGVCQMQYLNPVPDAASLDELYALGTLSHESPEVELQSDGAGDLPASAGNWRVLARRVDRFLRGRPHNWPDEPGRGRAVLDFGCSDARKLVHWHRLGWKVAGIDLHRSAIQTARRRFPDGQFWCGDLLRMEIRERFDVIRCDNVVEHLLNPLAYLEALRKLLRPGGRVRLFVPNGAALSTRLFGGYSYVYWPPFHVNLLAPKTLRQMLERAGFVDAKTQTFTPFGSWAYTQRQLLLPPGFDRRPVSWLPRALRLLTPANYVGEILSQWIGLGEELIGTARTP